MAFTLAWHWLLSLLLLACVPLQVGAQALQPVPALTARVIDQTGTLAPDQRGALEAQLAAIEGQHGSQVVVLMVATTAPEDIAAYAYRVASSWKIGRRDVGDGLLVVVAKDDRRMRIEVARKLEGAIPDIAAARILDETLQPRFRANDYAGGLRAALTQIEALIAGEQLPAPAQAPAKGTLDLESLAIFLFFGVAMLRPLARAIFGNRLGAVLMGAGTGAVAFWLTASLLLAGGAGIAALLITLLSNGKGMHIGGGGGGFGGGRGGGFGGGGGSFGGGGFSSGGGGSFGGGGASGSW